jgi:CheY-like chemotaxis protein
MLESFSFEVTLAASAEEGLEEIQKADTGKPYELVLMDWKMPGMDGLEASEQIKNHQTLDKIPAIILVTAYGREEIMRQAEQIGLDGFLIKPIDPSVLFDTIMQAFGEGISRTSRTSKRREAIEDLKDIRGAQVLLVEDNEINQQVAKEILAGGGLNVTVANDGQEAVNVVKDSHFDVVLMDIQMPVMDGYEATKRIRKWELGLRNENGKNSDLKSEIQNPKSKIQGIPIIAMTAHAMSGDEQKSLEAGMNDHITKPIDPDQLFATLQKWINPAADRAAALESLPASGGPAIIDTLAEPDLAIPNDDGLPESLPGFDLAAGLSRLMGNKRLYRKLLLDFGAKYGAVANEIREALDADDFNNAHSLIHNLKGLAGNLEATDLQAASVALEKLVKGQTQAATPGKGLDQTFLKLENALNQALEAARSLAPTTENQGPGSSEKVKASIPSDLIKPLIEPIKAAADMGDVTQIISIAEELKSKADSMAPLCDSLIKLAEDFDLDGIKNLMVELDN